MTPRRADETPSPRGAGVLMSRWRGRPTMRKCWAGLVLAAFLAAALPVRGATLPATAWPHTQRVDHASVTVFQPQVISWPWRTKLNARVALAVTPDGTGRPVLGTIEISGSTTTDFATRLVTLTDLKLNASHFPTLTTQTAEAFDARISAALAAMPPKRIPLDTVLMSLAQEAVKPAAVATNNDPPLIFYSPRPARLVVFDGEPVLVPAGQSGLEYAVNTNWDVFFDPLSGSWYLRDGSGWFGAHAAGGPYAPTAKLPPAFDHLPRDANFEAARKALPPREPKPASAPTIFVSMKPAEIIITDGPPAFGPIAGTALQAVRNTSSDLFLDTAKGRFYYLVSGRWFAAAGLEGPWHFATPELPADFARIPPGDPAARVLASVPGTPQAQEALIAAEIPQQATLKRGEATLAVHYAGPPQFQPIPGTPMTYAVNTNETVIAIEGKYYACHQGVWFVAPSPNGPWALAASVPDVIYTIPPMSPLYNVTYVKVYAATPTTVTYGYTAGYMMGFVSAGVVVYGTGYYYPPVVVPGPVPAYFPYPYSYAGNVYYNSATGAWARGAAVYGPYGGAAAGAAYNPATGAYARGGEVYGPYGGAGAWSAYNPATGAYAHGSAAWGPNGATANASFTNPRYGVSGSTNQNANAYGHWGSSVVSTPTQTVHTASEGNAQGTVGGFSSTTGAEGVGVHGAGGTNAGVAKGAQGNVYAGKDGNVYEHSSSGWSKWSDGGWSPVQPPAREAGADGGARGGASGATSYQQLEQDRRAREGGWQRQREWGGTGRFRRG
jgi:hypothetical protein